MAKRPAKAGRREGAAPPAREPARASAARPEGGPDSLVLLLFFMSGASGLIYEILFSRVLHLLMGSTVYSITTVLTAFMGGLALGAYVGGRRAGEIRHPVRAYAMCELLIGIAALAVPILLTLLTPVFRLLYATIYSTFLAWSMVTFALSALVLLPATTLMGATLPILTEGLTRRGAMVGRSAGKLYAINTMGAFAGAVLAGFVLIPNIGQVATLVVGVAINLGLYAVIMRRYPAPAATAPGVEEAPAPAPVATAAPGGAPLGSPGTVALVVGSAYAVSGFAAMLYQVGWTRATALSLGSSTYTFTIIVAAFIFGLASGAAVMSRLVDRLPRPLLAFAVIEIGVGISAAAVLPLFGRLPVTAYDLIKKHQASFAWLTFSEFVALFALICVPTVLMGALFPLSTSLLQSVRPGRTGARAVGLTYAVNTVGTIVGAFSTGFVLIPTIGVQNALMLASGLNILFGCLALLLPWPPGLVRATAAGVLVALLYPASRAIPRWDQWLLISGPYLLDPQFHESFVERRKKEGQAQDQIVYFEDDPNVNVAVIKLGDGYALKLNGKTDASTFQDMPTQRLAGHLPMLLHPTAKDVLVIGMGSGVTGGCAAAHASVERLDQVEIARAVIDAGRFFSAANHDILKNPRVTFIEGDGRVHILFTPRRYDVIVSEPSNPWIAGIGNLFTVDYFSESRDRLNPGGLMSAWVQTYRMSREGCLTVLRSFRKAFPDMTVWSGSPGDLILVGSRDGIAMDLDAMASRIRAPELEVDMKPLLIEEPADLLSHLVLSPEDAERVVAEGTRVNTDNNGWLEFHAPKVLYITDNVLRSTEALSLKGASDLPFRVEGSDAEKARLAERLPEVFRAKRKALEAEDARESGDMMRCERLAREAIAINPRELHATAILIDLLTRVSLELVNANRYAEAVPKLEELARLYPSFPQLAYRLSESYLRTERFADALPWLDKLKAREPDPTVLYNRGLALLRLGRAAEAVPDLEEMLKLDPGDPEGHLALGNARMAAGDHRKAVEAYDEAIRKRPGYFEAMYNRANSLWSAGDLEPAVLAYTELLSMRPEMEAIRVSIAAIEILRKRPEQALAAVAPVLASSPEHGQARMLRAEALLALGKGREALADLEWLALKAPDVAKVQLGLGDAYLALGEADRARQAFARAFTLDAAATREHLKASPELLPPS